MIFVLQNIRSAWNVGSILRTADAVGAEVVCLGYTARPVEPALKLIKKTAIGAENTVKWHSCEDIQAVLAHFPVLQGYQHIAIEINDNSKSLLDYLAITKISDTSKICLWLGNEIGGLDAQAVEACTEILHLPMKGMKESLNVANTATTVAYLFEQAQLLATKAPSSIS
jgi:23S rRNA (guanosine2251-2'-O)-methyltransferase